MGVFASRIMRLGPNIDPVLNNNDWDVISDVASLSKGANYWAVGDCKEFTLDGTVGALTLSNYICCVFIIGFDHNAAIEGDGRIHFQLGKTALTGGTDIALVDSSYETFSSSTAFRMNTSSTNSGGWNNSYMRRNICGTSLTSYSGTIIGVIPAELRNVLKSVMKYTNNTGRSTASSAVTATTDYFFPLSEYEAFGHISYANTFEANYQQQYAYYSVGNSKVKYRHIATTTAAGWWLRSPSVNNSSYFVFVYTSGGVARNAANFSFGFAPGFCV